MGADNKIFEKRNIITGEREPISNIENIYDVDNANKRMDALFSNPVERLNNMPSDANNMVHFQNNSNLYDARPVQIDNKNIGSTYTAQDENLSGLADEANTGDIIDELFGGNMYEKYGGGFWGSFWNEFKNSLLNPVGTIVNAIDPPTKTMITKRQPVKQATSQQSTRAADIVEASGKKKRSYKTVKSNYKKKKMN